MPRCIKIRRKRRQVCIGDLDTLVTIKSRVTTTKNFVASVVFQVHSAPFVMWETIEGVEIFDETNTGTISTDMIILRNDATVTKELFVELDGVHFRILSVEDLDRRNEFMVLMLTERGVNTKGVNDA
jgi:hypothetical protein